jgi:cell division protein FtsQ
MIAQGLVDRLRPRGAARASGHRRAARSRTPAHSRRLGRRGRIALISIVAGLLVLGGAWMWFRDSPLVSVQRVAVVGESGPDAGQIRSALESAARTMTTLDVQIGRLRRAVAPYPIVKDIRVTTKFPHGMRIDVVEQVAVAMIDAGGRKVAVAPDGTLLHDVAASGALPSIPENVPLTGTAVTGGGAMDAIRLLASAPSQMLSKISQVTTVASHGLVAQVRGGPSIYFGDPTELSAKWIAAVAVLADPGSAGALYIDVTDPQRPAAGPGDQSASSSASAAQTPGSDQSPTGVTGG